MYTLSKKHIVVLVCITIFLVIVLLYFFYQNREKSVSNRMSFQHADTSYYAMLKETCATEEDGVYDDCCMSSIDAMRHINAVLAPSSGCGDLDMDQLRCTGSLKWCVPSQDTVNLDTQYDVIKQRCEQKEINMREDCLEALNIMMENGYAPAPCDSADYPNGFIVNGLDCIGCEDVNWCEPKI